MLVPRFRSNLLSVSRMTDCGYIVTFKKNCAFVNRPDGSTALMTRRQGQLYVVGEAAQQASIARNAQEDNRLR